MEGGAANTTLEAGGEVLEEFELFTFRVAVNVAAYTVMSAGETLLSLTFLRAPRFRSFLSLDFCQILHYKEDFRFYFFKQCFTMKYPTYLVPQLTEQVVLGFFKKDQIAFGS